MEFLNGVSLTGRIFRGAIFAVYLVVELRRSCSPERYFPAPADSATNTVCYRIN
jgi:hypothetical protein